jgi:hypothetical protein
VVFDIPQPQVEILHGIFCGVRIAQDTVSQT